MPGLIKGITVTLYEVNQTGTDELGAPVLEEIPVAVPGCLVAPSNTDDITDSIRLHGRRAQYILAVPKGDTHDWTGKKVRFFGTDWRVFGYPLEGIEENIPLSWNKKFYLEVMNG